LINSRNTGARTRQGSSERSRIGTIRPESAPTLLAVLAERKVWRLFAAILIFWTFGGATLAHASSGATDRVALVSELTRIVVKHGWPTDLGRMCVAMKLGSEVDCKFTQVSVSPSEPGTVDSYGFNVPLRSVGPAPYVVMFHLGPLVGDFFVVSLQGKLKASFYRAKGIDYTEVPLSDARRAFDASVEFWRTHLQPLKNLIAAGNLPKP
jgi:hypothetical protein